MRPDCSIRPQAQTDIDDHAEYIARDSLDAAVRLLAAVEQTFALLCDRLEIGTAWESDNPRLAGVRRYPVTGFANHLVFHRLTARGLEVLRVLHGARDIPNILADDFGPSG